MENEQPARKHKGGRPSKEATSKLGYKIGLRFTLVESTLIKIKAKNAGVTPSRYIRESALTGNVKGRLSQEEQKLFRSLEGMANNLNQIAKEAHKQNLALVIPRLLETMKAINQTIQSYDNKN
jgi:hypothetical protein